MKRYILIVIMMLLVCCSSAGCSENRESVVLSTTEGFGDAGDETVPVDVSSFVFEELPACTIDNSFEYLEGNEICTVSNVSFTPNKIRLYVTFNQLSSPVENAQLVFKAGSGTVTATLSYVFSYAGYEILLPRKSVEAFKMTGFSGSPCNARLGEFKEFGFLVRRKGTNTLKYFGFNRIFILDKKYNVINDVVMNGFGKEVINQGSEYYAEVIV